MTRGDAVINPTTISPTFLLPYLVPSEFTPRESYTKKRPTSLSNTHSFIII